MKLYLISQDENDDYDTYDAAIVAAESAEAARLIKPDGREWDDNGTWCNHPDKVTVELIGDAVADITPGVVLSSFRTG